MKDKRLDALLATLPEMKCYYYDEISKSYKDPPKYVCTMVDSVTSSSKKWFHPTTSCQGDIRKCEREE